MNNRQSRTFLMHIASLSVASKVAVAALVAMAVAEFIGILLLEGEHPPVALVIELLLLGLAGLVLTRRWWASALAAGLSGLFTLLALSSAVSILAEGRILDFIFAAMFLGLALVATIAGTRATVQNYRNRGRVSRQGL